MIFQKEKQTYIYLIKELSYRDIYSRHKGSMLGIFWALLTPVAMLLVFSFIFGEVFKAKWPGNELTSKVDFSINLFIGLSMFWFFADILSRAPTLISSVPNYVKKVIFPLEVLPIVSLISGLFHLFIYIIIIFIAVLLSKGSIHLSVLSLPLVIITTLPLLVGSSLLLGSLGVYAKDISAMIGVIINLLMFLSPVFYPLSAIPQHLQWLFELNPLTLVIESVRGAFMHGVWPEWDKLAIYFCISLFIYFLGYMVFKVTKKGFADVI